MGLTKILTSSLVYVTYNKKYQEVINNRAGNGLFTRLTNAVKKASHPDDVVIEYKLVPTGKVYGKDGKLINND